MGLMDECVANVRRIGMIVGGANCPLSPFPLSATQSRRQPPSLLALVCMNLSPLCPVFCDYKARREQCFSLLSLYCCVNIKIALFFLKAKLLLKIDLLFFAIFNKKYKKICYKQKSIKRSFNIHAMPETVPNWSFSNFFAKNVIPRLYSFSVSLS